MRRSEVSRPFTRCASVRSLIALSVAVLAVVAAGCAEGSTDSTYDWVQNPTGGAGGTTGAGGVTAAGGTSGGSSNVDAGHWLPTFPGGGGSAGTTGGGAPNGPGTGADGGSAAGARGDAAVVDSGSGNTTGSGATMGGSGSTTGGSGSTTGGGATAGGSGNPGGGPIGDCPCNTPPPSQLNGATYGPFKSENVIMETGSGYLPQGTGPFAAIAVIGGFTNIGPEMELWGPFYASWGIAAVITTSGPLDTPDLRAEWLLGAIKDLKQSNATPGSPFFGKLSGQYGTSGYSMGGGGTTIASTTDKTLRSSIGLAPWSPVGRGITTPTLHFCGDIDGVAPCSYAQSSYSAIPSATPKMMITISGCDHLLCWFSPDMSTDAISGGWALAFNKVYLEGDMRWKPLLLQKPANGSVQTNIK